MALCLSLAVLGVLAWALREICAVGFRCGLRATRRVASGRAGEALMVGGRVDKEQDRKAGQAQDQADKGDAVGPEVQIGARY